MVGIPKFFFLILCIVSIFYSSSFTFYKIKNIILDNNFEQKHTATIIDNTAVFSTKLQWRTKFNGNLNTSKWLSQSNHFSHVYNPQTLKQKQRSMVSFGPFTSDTGLLTFMVGCDSQFYGFIDKKVFFANSSYWEYRTIQGKSTHSPQTPGTFLLVYINEAANHASLEQVSLSLHSNLK
jgi:hypothetical protein